MPGANTKTMENTMPRLAQYEILVALAARCREMYGPGTAFEALIQACSNEALLEAMKQAPDDSDEGS